MQLALNGHFEAQPPPGAHWIGENEPKRVQNRHSVPRGTPFAKSRRPAPYFLNVYRPERRPGLGRRANEAASSARPDVIGPSYLAAPAPLGNHGASAARAHAEADRLAHCRRRHIPPDGGSLREAARPRGEHAWGHTCECDVGGLEPAGVQLSFASADAVSRDNSMPTLALARSTSDDNSNLSGQRSSGQHVFSQPDPEP